MLFGKKKGAEKETAAKASVKAEMKTASEETVEKKTSKKAATKKTAIQETVKSKAVKKAVAKKTGTAPKIPAKATAAPKPVVAATAPVGTAPVVTAPVGAAPVGAAPAATATETHEVVKKSIIGELCERLLGTHHLSAAKRKPTQDAPATTSTGTRPSLIIGADHGGYEAKEYVKALLQSDGYAVEDFGTDNPEFPSDYPLVAIRVAREVARRRMTGQDVRGILICGSGTGMTIAANKVCGIRAALGYDDYSARMSRRDNDANILTLRGREFPQERYASIIRAWLEEPFSGEERHLRRIRQIATFERPPEEERPHPLQPSQHAPPSLFPGRRRGGRRRRR